MDVIAQCKATYPWTCHLCSRAIPNVHRDEDLAYQVDHVLPVSTHPHLTRVLANCRPSHRQCNRYRSDRPLTPELIAEITAKFGITERPALAIFGSR
jgi:5-methylcytosine-specific restriction endonuclease McrA